MNMKKTIAAIAAGAVAVSAMATTVSALAAKELKYNLVKTIKEDNKGVGTITATFTNVPLEAGGNLIVDTKSGHGWDTMVTISGSFWDDAAGTNKSFVPVVATTMDWETGYSLEGSKLWDGTSVKVPVVNNTANGTNVALKATSSAVITVNVKYTALKNDLGYVGDLNKLLQDGTIGIRIISLTSGTAYTGGINTGYVVNQTNTTAAGGWNWHPIYIKDQDKVAQLSTQTESGMFVLKADSKWYAKGKDAKADVTSVSLTNGGATMTDPSKVSVTLASVPVSSDGTYTLMYDSANWKDTSGNTWTLTLTGVTASTGDTVTVKYTAATADGTADMSQLIYDAVDFMNTVAIGDVVQIAAWSEDSDGVLYASAWSGAGVDTTAGNSEQKWPYRSSLTNSLWVDKDSTGYGDVFDWIGYANSDNNKDQWEITNAVKAVVNDAIQNYGDVVFTFNTATSKVKDDKYDDDGTDYTSFGRHFWDRDTGYDANTMYITADWVGNNLFEGALIINNNLTLSLGATDKFDWTATSLSFSWDAIQDAALTQNQYANYIQNMILRTSTVWYWDNMVVTLGETEVDEVESGAPVEADDQDLPEDEEDDLGIVEDEEEEEEEEETNVEPESEVAPVETATNPGTGNASVALAVIPVALAAAAIVAKKRG